MRTSLVLMTLLAALTGIKASAAGNPLIIIETSLGKMEVELDQAKAPETVKNFLAYVDAKFYDGTIFHRVIPGFMIQGGGMTPDMNQKETYPPIKNEAANGLKNKRGSLAMARTADPNSATSQFFINLVDNSFLDYRNDTLQGIGYAVFGKVTKGMEVADKIAKVATGNKGMHQNVPLEPVLIKAIKRK